MNKDNYASIESSKRLVDAGIVLETEFHWVHDKVEQMSYDAWSITLSDTHSLSTDDLEYPTPSMAEVWRELPKLIVYGGLVLEKVLCQRDDSDDNFASYCWEPTGGYCEAKALYKNTNPTDALIDLLIWVKCSGAGRSETMTPELNKNGTVAGSEYGVQQPGPVEQYHLWKYDSKTYKEPSHEDWIRALSEEEQKSARLFNALVRVCSSMTYFSAITIAKKAIDRM